MDAFNEGSIVVDSSISLKWALPDEEYVVEASALRDLTISNRGDFVAPLLWRYEVTSGLVVAVRRGRLAGAAARQALANILALGVRFADPDALDVFAEAQRLGIGAHDATYIALARLLGLPLWTGDHRLHQTASRSIGFIHWIGDFQTTP